MAVDAISADQGARQRYGWPLHLCKAHIQQRLLPAVNAVLR